MTPSFAVETRLKLVHPCTIVVQDKTAPSAPARLVALGAKACISAKVMFSRSKRTLRDVLERLKWQRQQSQLRKQLWLQYADPVVHGASADTIFELQQQLEHAELELSRLPQLAWDDRANRIELPTLCGSRPYFPAAP